MTDIRDETSSRRGVGRATRLRKVSRHLFRRARPIRGLLLVGCFGMCACAMPVKVSRLDPAKAAPQNGVRYVLRAPVFNVYLKPNLDAGSFEIVVEEKPTGDATDFEIATSANVFADTDLSVTLDDDGQGLLTAFSAGSTDRTLEIIQAAASLAAKGAAVKAECKDLRARLKPVQEAISFYEEANAQLLAEIAKPKPDQKQIEKVIGLQKAVDARRDSVSGMRVSVKKDEFAVDVLHVGAKAPQQVVGSPGACINVHLVERS